MTGHEVEQFRIKTKRLTFSAASAGDVNAPALILLHGGADRWQRWGSVMGQLAATFRVIAPDLRGHGDSEHPASGYEFSDYVEDVISLMDALEVEWAFLAGHSLGGLIAAHVAAAHPDRIRGLVLEDPPLEWSKTQQDYLDFMLEARRKPRADAFQMISEVYWHLDEAEWQRISDWLHDTAEAVLTTWASTARQEQGERIFETLTGIACPTLILQADPASGAALSHDAAARARRAIPNAQHMLMANAGHAIHVELPEEFALSVQAFLGRID